MTVPGPRGRDGPTCSTSGPRSTCSTRTGAARPGTPRAPGTRWCDASQRADGNVVISHEILAGAKPDKIAKAMNDLAGNEVHIVYSARDLGRQLPAAWQESIKQGRKWPFRRFLDQGRARPDLVLQRDGPARPCWRAGAPSCRPSGSTSSPSRTTAAPTATSCGCASAARSASTRRGRRSTPSATTGRSASPRPRCCASSTGASSSACGATRPTTPSSASCSPRRCWSPARRCPVRLPPDRYDFAEQQAERLDRLDQGQRRRRGR